MMIANELEYRTTKAALRRFEEGLAHVQDGQAERHPLAQKALRESIESEIQVLEQQLRDYEALRDGAVTQVTVDSLDRLPDVLIAARIAAGWSQKDLAERLELKHQQIQRYEASRYETASFDRLLDVADALGIKMHAQVTFTNSAVTA
ncbi:MAG: helix-turn-helix domain-containing protein [Dehalococcoidia bacterium]